MSVTRRLVAALIGAAGLCGVAEANPDNVGKVIITEIFANPNDSGTGQINPAGADILEFIEIFNTTNEPIDISGWRLDDEDAGSSEPFPAGTILGPRQALAIIGYNFGLRPDDPANPGQYLPQTPIWSAALFNQCWDPTPGDGNAPARNVLFIPGNITIANTPTLFNEVPFIVDADGTVVDIVVYGSEGFPAVTAGQSIVLRPQFLNHIDNDRGCAWQLASFDPVSLSSNETIFEYDPDGDGPLPVQTRDRFADAGNIASPGIVNEVIPPPSDCNNNGIDDAFETCGETSSAPDCNGNLIPDSCEPDLNNNGVPDDCDILLDREGTDRNMNNVLDSVDIDLAGGTNGVGGALDVNGNGIIDAAEGFGKVIITEIMVDPFATITGGSLEWVEIKNVSAGPVDISGYRLLDLETGGDGYTLPVPAGTVLAAGEIAVLCQLPETPSSLGGPNYTAEQMVGVYQALWGETTPEGANIRWIPLGRWGARATNATPTAETLTLVSGAAVRDDLVPAGQPSVSAPHPGRLVGPGGIGTWVTDRGYVVDMANYCNANSNGEPLAGWPGSEGHSSFFLLPGSFSVTGNNPGPNWRLSIGGLNGARISNDLTGLPGAPFGVGNMGEDFGSPGFVPTTLQLPTGDVIISEIAATTNSIYPGSNPTPPVGQSVAGGRDEFVEIVNTTGSAIDLTGWYLQDEDGRTQGFPAGTVLQPGAAAVVIGVDTFVPGGNNQPGLLPLDGRDFAQEFYDTWGCGYLVIPVTDWYTSNRAFGLDRLADAPTFINEVLRLVKADGTVADVVSYDDDDTPTAIAFPPFGWPGDAVAGIDVFWSIYVLPGAYTGAANDLGINWAASLTGFEGGRQSEANAAVDGSGFPTGLFNRSMFGSPGFVEGLASGPIIPPGDGCRPTQCAADFNGDTFINPDDLADFITCFFVDIQIPGFCPEADFNGDTSRDPDDLADFITTFFVAVQFGC